MKLYSSGNKIIPNHYMASSILVLKGFPMAMPP